MQEENNYLINNYQCRIKRRNFLKFLISKWCEKHESEK